MTPVIVGCPPRLHGPTPGDLVHWAIACRASAAVLDLEGQRERAVHLRGLAEAADRRIARLAAAEAQAASGMAQQNGQRLDQLNGRVDGVEQRMMQQESRGKRPRH